MSGSSSSLTPSRIARRGSRPSRTCDFGPEHVSRDRYEDKKAEIAACQQRVQEKDAELLSYHNQIADLTLQLETANASQQTSQRELDERQKEIDRLVKECDEAQEELVEAAQGIERLGNRGNTLKAEKDLLTQELAEAKKRIRELSPDRREAKRLLTESKDLRARNTQVEKELKNWRTKAFFTPPPPDNLEPLRSLHPNLADKPVEQLPKELLDILVYNLNDIWSHLPQHHEQALVTPGTWQLNPVLERLKNTLIKDKEELVKQQHTLEKQVQEWRNVAESLTATPGIRPPELEARVRKLSHDKEELRLNWEAAETRENLQTNRVQLLAQEIQRWETVFQVFPEEENICGPEQAEHKLSQIRDAIREAEETVKNQARRLASPPDLALTNHLAVLREILVHVCQNGTPTGN